MAGFEAIYERIVTAGIFGELWIDGSFLTKKIDPDDIDVLLLMPSVFEYGTEEQDALIDWLTSKEDDPKQSFRCDIYVEPVYNESHPWRNLTVDMMRHWEEGVYGFSVTTRQAKGIAVIKIEKPSTEALKPENPPEESISQ